MTRRSGLGRGLGALLPSTEQDAAVAPETGLMELNVTEIHPNRHQPRTEFRGEDLDELAASIREQGILQPVVVRPRPEGGYELLVGERRLRASKLAGATRVPAIIRHADDRQALEQALVENLQRADLQPLEEALAYKNLVELFELRQEEVARRVGKSRVYITNTLRLLELPDEVKSLIAAGRLQAGHARALLGFKDSGRLLTTAKRAADRGLTVRQIEELARAEDIERAEREPAAPKRRFPDSMRTWEPRCASSPGADADASRSRSAPATICTVSSSCSSATDARAATRRRLRSRPPCGRW